MFEQPIFSNRLAKEKSPHLLQHAHNPVDWYPWGEEAFERAKNEDKPIFLSIGYFSCHWCHRMREECFQNPDIASMMNEVFVCIKVDREELPQVDALYMEFAQTLAVGVAGWPLNVVLTPDLKPFSALSYVPIDGFSAALSLGKMISEIKEIWQGEERELLVSQADKIVESFENTLQESGSELPDELHLINTAELLFRLADPLYGGIKGMPKFVIVPQICFMLRFVYESSDSRALFYVERTLEMMSRGGVHDHLGGGFSRYAVDEKWVTPHFEKMLCDNALLLRSFLETWQLNKKEPFKYLAKKTLSYLLREMQSNEGVFYSSQDADSSGREGAFYTWSFEEIINLLGHDDSLLFCEFYNVFKEGNFHGRNILHQSCSLEEFAERHDADDVELKEIFEEQKKLLFEYRKKRSPPLRDQKIIVAWNALMMNSLALAAQVFFDLRFLDQAKKIAGFIKTRLFVDGNLLHRYCDGEAKYMGDLDDYAYLIQALLTLFEGDGDPTFLAWAMQLSAVLEQGFKAEGGAFYTSDSRDELLIMRRCEFIDGALPSANAVHCENLIRLYQMSGDERYWEQAQDILRAVKDSLDGFNPSYCYHLIALHWAIDPTAANITIALNENEDYQAEIRAVLARCFIPYKSIVWRREGDEHLFDLLPLTKEQKSIDGKTTVYISQVGSSMLPLTERADIIEAIESLRRIAN